jgi:hypothetical protein
MRTIVFVFLSLIFATIASSTNSNSVVNLESIARKSAISNTLICSSASRPIWSATDNVGLRLELSFVTLSTNLSLMLALGACFVLLGAFLRHRSGPRTTQRRNAANPIVTDRTGINPSPQAAKPNSEKSAPAVLPAFLAVQETLTDPAASNDGC